MESYFGHKASCLFFCVNTVGRGRTGQAAKWNYWTSMSSCVHMRVCARACAHKHVPVVWRLSRVLSVLSGFMNSVISSCTDLWIALLLGNEEQAWEHSDRLTCSVCYISLEKILTGLCCHKHNYQWITGAWCYCIKWRMLRRWAPTSSLPYPSRVIMIHFRWVKNLWGKGANRGELEPSKNKPVQYNFHQDYMGREEIKLSS